MARQSEHDRFWSKVEKTDTCWNWGGTVNEHGSPLFKVRRRNIRAHHWTFEKSGKGVVAPRRRLNQSCNNKLCVNPAHLHHPVCSEEWKAAWHGTPLPPKPHGGGGSIARPEGERFWEKVSPDTEVVSTSPEVSTPCWSWTAGTANYGYGKFRCKRNGKDTDRGAHVVSYELTYGAVPAGLWVLHKCDNPKCVNPEHLYAGTQEDNTDDRVKRYRSSKGSRNGSSKLTAGDIPVIRALLKNYGTDTIGDLYGVDRSAIYKIKVGKNWSHVA